MDFNIAKVMVFLVIFAIMVVGYMVGRISIKGVSLGSAGVFLVALVYGHFAGANEGALFSVEIPSFVQTFGLILFVTSVGFIAGPSFFRNLVKNAKSYVLLGVVVIGSAALACVFCILVSGTSSGLQVGILSGSLTTTPGFSAAQDAVAAKEIVISNDLQVVLDNGAANGFDAEDIKEANKLLDDVYGCTLTDAAYIALEDASDVSAAFKAAVTSALLKQVSVGYAVAYPFGVVGIVLFVQIMPRLLKVNMDEERMKLKGSAAEEKKDKKKKAIKLIEIDELGLSGFALAVILGLTLGGISIPLPGGASFALGNTGGPLVMSLIFGHFAKIGKFNITPKKEMLEIFRELGLVLFLMGAGADGGTGFVQIIKEEGIILFVYGAIMTIVPMVLGYIVARYVLKLSLLNNLGSLTGGMTSTPALGTLIQVAETADVASAYAATYPIALVAVVLASQCLCIFL